MPFIKAGRMILKVEMDDRNIEAKESQFIYKRNHERKVLEIQLTVRQAHKTVQKLCTIFTGQSQAYKYSIHEDARRLPIKEPVKNPLTIRTLNKFKISNERKQINQQIKKHPDNEKNEEYKH